MTLGNIGTQPQPIRWLNKGWSTLKESAQSALTHFKHDAHEPSNSQSKNVTGSSPSNWGLLAADVIDHGDDIEIRMEAPGLDKSELSVEIYGGRLIVTGEKTMSSSREAAGCFIAERAFGQFSRSIPIPEAVDGSSARAHYKDGVLIVRIAKDPQSGSSTIAVH